MFLFIAVNFDDATKNKLGGITRLLFAAGATSGNFHSHRQFSSDTDLYRRDVRGQAPAHHQGFGLGNPKALFAVAGALANSDGRAGTSGGSGKQTRRSGLTFISEGLRERGFDIERRAYRPHITLGRQVIPGPGFESAAFEATLPLLNIWVKKISLMKSERIRGQIKYFEVYGKDLE